MNYRELQQALRAYKARASEFDPETAEAIATVPLNAPRAALERAYALVQQARPKDGEPKISKTQIPESRSPAPQKTHSPRDRREASAPPRDATAIRVTFLGTSSGVPTRSRNVSGIAVQLPQRSETWLLDCGEATQHQLIRHPDLKFGSIRRIFITHMHGDHIYGLPGLLSTCGMSNPPEAIDVYGPPGLKNYLDSVLRWSESRISYPFRVHAVEPGMILEEKDYVVFCAPLDHRVQAFGYRIVERDRPGTFDIAKAKADNIPSGPIYGKLKAGKSVELPDGRIIDGRDYVGSPQPGRILTYCTDTIFCRNAIDLARGADLLIHEATFATRDLHLAKRAKHSTAAMAAQVAFEAKAETLMMTHFSPRYAPDAEITLDDVLNEAREIFPNTLVARDRLTHDIPRRSGSSD